MAKLSAVVCSRLRLKNPGVLRACAVAPLASTLRASSLKRRYIVQAAEESYNAALKFNDRYQVCAFVCFVLRGLGNVCLWAARVKGLHTLLLSKLMEVFKI